MTMFAHRQKTELFRWIIISFAIGAAAVFLPFLVPLVLAAWVAVLARPLLVRIAKAAGGRHRAAGVLVVLLVMGLFVPLGIAIVSLSRGAIELARSVLASDSAKNALVAVVSGGPPEEGDSVGSALEIIKSPEKIMMLVQDHGAAAAQLLGGVAGAATQAILSLFVFVYAVYVFLVDGKDYYLWLEKHLPIEPGYTKRLAAAFNETGRGLFIGVGLTGLTQGVIATITYFALGVPRAFVLGLLTCVASLIPSVGTALIWVPVALGLALAGSMGSAGIMLGVGVGVIGLADNVMRPIFARFGKLELPVFVLLIAIFGGLAMFGVWGLLLGPLLARLAKEALTIAREAGTEERLLPIEGSARVAEEAPPEPR